jgi:hypothetical protein
MEVTCAPIAETAEVTSKRFGDTIPMRSVLPNGWKRAQSARNALRASQTSLGITAIAVVRSREKLVSPNAPMFLQPN